MCKNVYSYYFPCREQDENNATAIFVDKNNDINWSLNVACHHAWVYQDGWEWMKTGDVVVLLCNGNVVCEREIRIDFSPAFSFGDEDD
jgi:hypothetical protein